MSRVFQKLRMRRAPGEDQALDGTDEGEAIKASGDALIIANAIHDLADAIREYGKELNGEDNEVDDGQFDLAGNRIHT